MCSNDLFHPRSFTALRQVNQDENSLMNAYQSFLKTERAALEQSHPELSAKDRLAMARKKCIAQIPCPHQQLDSKSIGKANSKHLET